MNEIKGVIKYLKNNGSIYRWDLVSYMQRKGYNCYSPMYLENDVAWVFWKRERNHRFSEDAMERGKAIIFFNHELNEDDISYSKIGKGDVTIFGNIDSRDRVKFEEGNKERPYTILWERTND